MRRAVEVVSLALVGLVVAGAPAQNTIDNASRRGADYLKRAQGGGGEWSNASNFGIGSTGLIAMALLNCGEPPNAPVIERAAASIREGALAEGRTYQLSIAIQFLDKLMEVSGNLDDEPLLQVLALRLIAGQTPTGGWSYNCIDQLPQGEAARLKALLPPNTKPEDFPLEKEAAQIARIAAAGRAGGRGSSMSDNSNTQFAVLSLWVARRHQVPVDGALNGVAVYFRSTAAGTGGWGYMPPSGGGPGVASEAATPAMTCAGLIGLAVAGGTCPPAAVGRGSRPRPRPPP
jgi:hypothetical protein